MRVIVFVLRGCSASWLGTYGNEWIATPNLDRFAAESVVFDRHISDRPDSPAACTAWVQRTLPSGQRLNDKLKAANVFTVIVRANHPDTDGPDWFYAGWSEVFDARPREEDKSPLDALIRALPSLLDRLAEMPDFLLWIDIDRLLPPWDVRQDVFTAYVSDDEDSDETITPCTDPPTGPFDTSDPDAVEWLHWSLAALVTTLDAELGTIFEQLRSRGFDQSATWLLTSDFGYPLAEHGYIGMHRPWLHEELVHLPLVLRLPQALGAGRRIAGFTQPPDIAITMLDLFGVKLMEGTSLLPLAQGEGEAIRPHAISSMELGDAAEAAIRTDSWAYLVPLKVPEGEKREPQLFVKPDDRWEVNDLRSQNTEVAEELEAKLKE